MIKEKREKQENEYHISFLIRDIRKERQMPQEELCRGLCHANTLAKMEAGQEELPKWLADVFLERLGVSPNHFGCHQNWQEEEEYQHRRKVLCHLRQKEWEEFDQIYQEGDQELEKGLKYPGCLEQFSRYVGLVREGYGKDRVGEKGLSALEQEAIKALRMTVPDFNELLPGEKQAGQALPGKGADRQEGTRLRFGRIEWALAVLLADLRYQQEEKRREGYRLYQRILLQMPEQIQDESLLRECYPYVLAMILSRLQESGDRSGRWLARKGIEFLQKWVRLYGLEAMLSYEIWCAETEEEDKKADLTEGTRISEEEAEEPDGEEEGLTEEELEQKKQDLFFYRRALATLQEIHREYGRQSIDFPFYLAKLAEPATRGQSQGDMLRRFRLSLGMTQKEACQDICSERELSDIENHRHEPRREVFQKLAERYGQEGVRYFPFVDSDSYRLHQCREEVAHLVAVGKYEEAEFELGRLEAGLDMGKKRNRQYMMRLRAIIGASFGRISQEKALTCLEEALALSVPPGKVEGWPLEQQEIVLLNNIANQKEAMGDLEGAAVVLQETKRSCEGGWNGVEDNREGYMMTLYNLSRYLGNLGRSSEALELYKMGIFLAYELGNGRFLERFFYKKAWDLEELYKEAGTMGEEQKETCLKLYRQAFCLAYVLRQDSSIRKIRNQCQKEYGIRIDLEYRNG